MKNIKSAVSKAIQQEKESSGQKARPLNKDEIYFFNEAHKAGLTIAATTRAYNKVFDKKMSRYWVTSVFQRLGFRD